MKNVRKYIIISAALAVVITVFAVLMIMYDKGVFDISFIKRADPVTSTAETETEPEEETTGESVTDTEGTDTSEETDSEETAAPSVFDELHETIPATNGKVYIATEKTYDKDTMSLYRLDTLTLPRLNVTGDNMTRTRYLVTRSDVLRSFTEKQVSEMRRAVDVYMGMLVVSDGTSLSFYNGSGIIMYKYTGEEELVFAYERDKEDRPLFILGEEYYYIDANSKTLVKSDFDKSESRGLYYNYTSDFAKDAKKAKFWNYKTVEQKDEGAIGSLYFDHGYVMVRNIKYERDDEDDGKVVEDMEIIVDEDGREFPLPEGYAAKAYSDERILVEYKNKYGFYAVKGAWIADSVYTYATPYYEGLAVVGTMLQRGVIDLDGNFVIPLSYTHISVCSGGIIVCWSAQTGYEVYIKVEN